MAGVPEIAALKFKFDAHALPALPRNLPFGIAIGESGLDGFDHVAQIFRDHPKQKHNALFEADGQECLSHSPKLNRCVVIR
jgi:hypothetical protein